MISPSRVHHQQQKQPSRDNSDVNSHVRLQKGRKPLEKKSFYLDVKNHALAANLEAKIKDLGGVIELFLVRSVTLAVSDRAEKFGQNSCDRRKWGYGSGESGGPPSLRSVEVPTPIATPPTPFGGEYPLSNSTNTRGQTAQRTKSRADAMLERALTQPQQCSVDPLDNAQSWGIPIWATKKLQSWLEKIYDSLKETGNLKRAADQSNSEKSLRVKNLKNSYIKFESFRRDTRPVFLELPLWPKLNFDGDQGTCPFDTRIRGKKVCKQESAALNKDKGKEMTRRPRATATRARRTEQLVAGFCEICRIDYRDLSKHVQSDKHVAFIRNDDNFLALDKLIDAGASVEAFLRANDVGSDCNVYPDVDGSLGNLDDDKAKKNSKTDLSNFGVDEIKMVQCNGTRRNHDLKLGSPHNLRTRAKHESGHLLRSKGSPWHEGLQEKSEKFCDKFEGFTIKKRAKGTIWIEEDDCSGIDDVKTIDDVNNVPIETPTAVENNFSSINKDLGDESQRKCDSIEDPVIPKLERNDLTLSQEIDNDNRRIINIPHLEKETRTTVERSTAINGTANSESPISNNDCLRDECKNGFNGFERTKTPESFPASQLPGNSNSVDETGRKKSVTIDGATKDIENVCNGGGGTNDDGTSKNSRATDKETKDEKSKIGGRIGKRSGRGFRGRPRLSVEERLIEDNRAYYKVEVLGNKLRSSTGPWSAIAATNPPAKINNEANDNNDAAAATAAAPAVVQVSKKDDDKPSSEKPVVVRFKRVRRSELSLLSDEAESFMFGEPKRDDGTSSDMSDDDQTSVLPRETESEIDDAACTTNSDRFDLSSSSMVTDSSIKEELIVEDESQDSIYNGRAKKRRRTQAEMLLKENEEYYTFETPGSRLRFQGFPGNTNKEHPIVGRKSARPSAEIDQRKERNERKDPAELEKETHREEKSQCQPIVEQTIAVEPAEKLYPSKPSPEVEKMQFSFEAVPRSEPWYQTYQRQDAGAEFWHCFSDADERRPFLLPYEIENFHETLAKLVQKNDVRKKNRRGPNGIGRSPRKSPRCHASTLAIMSTIIRKREQLTNLSVLEEECSSSCAGLSQNDNSKPITIDDPSKTDTDDELRDIAKNIDVMLSADGILDLDDSFEAGLIQQVNDATMVEAPTIPRGPPPDLLELLDNCHGYFNCRENSSCASSECGESAVESPLKRRKRRKNRTGWPGIKMRKKLQTKPTIENYGDSDASALKKMNDEDDDDDDYDNNDDDDDDDDDDKKKKKEKKNKKKTTTTTISNVAVDTKIFNEILRENSMDTTIRQSVDKSETINVADHGREEPNQVPADSCSSEITSKLLTDETTVVKTELNESSKNGVDRETTTRINDDKSYRPPLQCEIITGSEETVLSSKEDIFARKENSNDDTIGEGSENSMTNDENDEVSVSTRQLNAKNLSRKRVGHLDPTSETMDARREITNNDNMYIKNVKSSIISRKNYANNNSALTSKKRNVARDASVATSSPDSERIVVDRESGPCQKVGVLARKQSRTNKRQRRGTLRSELAFENENCKNSTTVKSAKTSQVIRGVKRRNNDQTSAESLDSDVDCGLGERVSPSLPVTTNVQNRRSSIEFQPVVRMMKIEDQVDMDHSILSVTVASNRRLRSSSSPRSNPQPPAKRYKRSKGPFGRWLKNS